MKLMAYILLHLKHLAIWIPSTIYDTLISKMLTNYSYERLATLINAHRKSGDEPLRILDIGVGTAVPLYRIWERLPMRLDLLGVDIDRSYILKAQRLFRNIVEAGGSRKVQLRE